MWWIVGVVGVVVLVATYLTWLASRVDRLHERAIAAAAGLDAHLSRRHALAAAMAETYHRPDLRDAVRAALVAGPDERELAENDLTRVLRSLPYLPDGPEMAEVAVASRRVALARQVHNDLARDALSVRSRRLVRLLRLGRRYAPPRYFDVDDPILGTSGTARSTAGTG